MLKAGTAARRRSLRWSRAVEPERVRQDVEQLLRELDQKIQERDPTWVGHCKLLLIFAGGSAYASMTAAGDSPRWAGRLQPIAEAELTLYVALYSWTDGDVAQIVDGLLDADSILVSQDVTLH